MSEVRCLKNLVRTKSEVSIFCTLLNTKTIRLKFVLHVVLAYLMFGMIFQAMSIKLPKAGNTIPEDSISTIKNMSKNKNEGVMPSFSFSYTQCRLTPLFKATNLYAFLELNRGSDF